MKRFYPTLLFKPTGVEPASNKAYIVTNNFIQDIDIIATYSDASGHIRQARLKMRDLSDSWIWENPTNGNNEYQKNSQVLYFDFVIFFSSGQCCNLKDLISCQKHKLCGE